MDIHFGNGGISNTVKTNLRYASFYTATGALTLCNGLSLAGKSWRLPNVAESAPLADLYRTANPLIDIAAFPNTATGSPYWQGTTNGTTPTYAYILSYFPNNLIS